MSTRAKASSLALAVSFALCGPALAGELHSVTALPAKAAAGAPGKGSVVLTTKKGWHLNAEAPMSLKIAPAEGVTVAKPKLTRKDLAISTQDKAQFDVAFEAAAPGAKSIECEANFVICQESACKPVKETVTLKVDVVPPAKKK